MTTSVWKPIPWIFFDIDDTIWNFSANSTASLHKLYGISPILRKLFKSIDEFIEIYHRFNALMWDLYSKGEVSTQQLKTERWRYTLATRQFEVLTAVCEELDRNYLEILAQGSEVFPGMKELLQKLSKNYLLATLSNGFIKTQYQKLHYSGLEKFITRTIVSEEIGINKPDPRLFDYAVKETGAQQPLLMVGDNFKADILGALKAGWFALWYNPNDKQEDTSEETLKDLGVDPSKFLGTVKNVPELEESLNRFF